MIELKCKHCDRYIGTAESIVAELLCPNTSCKGSTQFKVVTADNSKMFSFKFPNAEKQPKKKEQNNG